MQNNEHLAKELLGQEGLVPGKLSDAERKEIRNMLATQWKRVQRMKWITIGSWILIVCWFLIFGWIDANRGDATPSWYGAVAVVTRILILIATIMSVSYYLRYRTASMNEIRVRLAAIEAKLEEAT